MSTRCFIAYKENGIYKDIYSHNDGYLTGVGATLLSYYNTLDRVKALLELGDLSYLCSRISDTDTTPDNDEGLITFAYGRDRNEKGTEAKEHANKKNLRFDEFAYLFTDGQWYYRTWEDKVYRELTQELTFE